MKRYSSDARLRSVSALQAKVSGVSQELYAATEEMEAPIKREAAAAHALAQAKAAEVQSAHEDANRIHLRRTSPADQARQANMEKELAQVQERISRLSVEQAELVRLAEEASAVANAGIERWRSGPASNTLLGVERHAQELLAEATAFEREVDAEAEASLTRNIADKFSADTKDFSEAEKSHKEHAKNTFRLMAVLLVVATRAVFELFIRARAQVPPVGATHLEQVLLLVTGRIAILFFLGLALRYLATLHRAHSEQAVLYRDRKAALGVAEVILNATPKPEQRLDTLKALALVHFRVGRSAFSMERDRHSSSFNAHMRQLKRMVEALKPVLDAVEKTKS